MFDSHFKVIPQQCGIQKYMRKYMRYAYYKKSRPYPNGYSLDFYIFSFCLCVFKLAQETDVIF